MAHLTVDPRPRNPTTTGDSDEDAAEARYLLLERWESVVSDGDVETLRAILDEANALVAPSPQTPPALSAAITVMDALIARACGDPGLVCGPDSPPWLAASRAARSSVVRESIELRMVVTLVPDEMTTAFA